MINKPFKAHHGAALHQVQTRPRLLGIGGIGGIGGFSGLGGLALACLLSACGQKGPLYMPTERSLAPLNLAPPRGEASQRFEGSQVAGALPVPKH